MLLIGAGFAAIGLYFMLIGAGVLPIPGGPRNLHAPLWIVVCAGLPFFLGGLAVLLQGIGKANASGELPPDAAPWMRVAQRLIVIVIFAAFAIIGSWIAIAGDARQFSGSVSGLGFSFGMNSGVTFARIAFGFGALICWLATGALIVTSMHMLAGRRRTSRQP
jgi:hypothetical protein